MEIRVDICDYYTYLSKKPILQFTICSSFYFSYIVQ